MLKICIFGSCVSRDIISRMDGRTIDLQLYAARSSFASLFSKSPFPDTYSEKLESSFQRRTLAMDIMKTAIPQLTKLKPHVILIDLIDERFDLVKGVNGGYCTCSTELKRAGFRHEQGERVRTTSEEFFKAWYNGWIRFIKLVDSKGLRGSVIINRSYYATHTISGVPFDAEEVRRANLKLERMYRIQESHLPPEQFIRYPTPRQCPDDHHWGVAPFHYDEESNNFAAKWVENFVDARSSLAPAVSA